MMVNLLLLSGRDFSLVGRFDVEMALHPIIVPSLPPSVKLDIGIVFKAETLGLLL